MFKKVAVSADDSCMDSVLRHRAFALLFSLLVGVTVASMPALAASGPLEAIMDDYQASSEAKLDWLEGKLAGSGTTNQKNQWYEQAVFWLTQKADDTLEELVIAAGSDPILLAQIPDLAEDIADMEQNFLEDAEKLYNLYVVPVVTTTSTLPPVTTTTLKLPPIPTTTLKLPPITTTTLPPVTTTSTSPTTSSTTTTTVAAVTTTTTRPVSGAATAASPPATSGGSPTAGSGGSGGDVALTQSPSASGGATGEVGSQVLSASASLSAQVPRSQFLFNVEPSEVVSARQMLVPYEPANLPSRLPAPVTSFFAVLQMVFGAFLSSFRQIGGPAAAGAIYLGYEVWRHLRSKAPGTLPA